MTSVRVLPTVGEERDRQTERKRGDLHAPQSLHLIRLSMTGFSTSPQGARWAKERGEERDEMHAEWIAVHPKSPRTREQCAITILRAEECVKRSKVA